MLATEGMAGLGPAFEEARRLYLEAGRQVNAAECWYALCGVALVEGRYEDERRCARHGAAEVRALTNLHLAAWGL